MLANDARGRRTTPNGGLLSRYPLVSFFVIAYLGSWLTILPYLRSASGAGLLPFHWPVPFAVSATLAPFAGPFLAAFVVTGATEGKPGIYRLLGRIVQWRVGLVWYLFALLGIPAIAVLGAIVVPGVLETFNPPDLALVLTYPLSFVVALIIGGPLGEEPGWRGFALPRLQRMYGPLGASAVLGPLWACWHLPYFWMPEWGTPKDTALDMVWYGLAAIALTVIYTWVFNKTKGSLVPVILMHASNDAFFIDKLFGAPIVTDSLLTFVIGFGATALLLVLLTRGRLGYEPSEQKEGGRLPP
jgi:membrane protease YdiL (CAAX protease family)